MHGLPVRYMRNMGLVRIFACSEYSIEKIRRKYFGSTNKMISDSLQFLN